MSWRIRTVHTTGYRYDAPVTESFNEVRLTPRADRRQNVVLSRVETTPAARQYRYTDYWGTVVHAFDLHAAHTELWVTGTSVVESGDDEQPLDDASWADLRADAVLDQYTEMLEATTAVPRDRELSATARTLRRAGDPAEVVLAAARWVHERLDYRPGITGVHSSAVDAWQAGEGVCQDFAHVTLLLLRSVGIPSRYVSGYLHTKPDGELGETVLGESHAWIESWTGGWWGYDPTNDIPVGQRHIAVATGREYADVVPLKGIYSGSSTSDMDVSVELTRLA